MPTRPQHDTGRGARVNNGAYDTRLQEFRDKNLSLSVVRDAAREAGHPVIVNQAGTESCLSYHVLGFCWANCSRQEDHRVHTNFETTMLWTWCEKCYREGGPY